MYLWFSWAFPGAADPVLGWSADPSFVGGLDLDQFRLLEKDWGDAESQEPSAEGSGPVPVPIPGTLSSEHPALM